MDLKEKERIEIEFWKNAPEEKPEVFSVPNLINKFKEADIFLEKLSSYAPYFRKSETILELGGGQCWASCMVKRYHSQKKVIASDISPHAVASAPIWEDLFKVKLDQTFAARSYEIPLPDASADLIFCFASAHHFVKQKATFRELMRVLKPSGVVLYLHEPVCREVFHGIAKARANKKRPVVPEDVLIYKRLMRLGKEAGFEGRLIFSPSTKNRSAFGSLYYTGLQKLPFLQHILPCTGDLIFEKKSAG